MPSCTIELGEAHTIFLVKGCHIASGTDVLTFYILSIEYLFCELILFVFHQYIKTLGQIRVFLCLILLVTRYVCVEQAVTQQGPWYETPSLTREQSVPQKV